MLRLEKQIIYILKLNLNFSLHEREIG